MGKKKMHKSIKALKYLYIALQLNLIDSFNKDWMTSLENGF